MQFPQLGRCKSHLTLRVRHVKQPVKVRVLTLGTRAGPIESRGLLFSSLGAAVNAYDSDVKRNPDRGRSFHLGETSPFLLHGS
jgi:hypothetical protein